jgi:2-hydroxychromene-2-carboxylate isomerase
LSRGSSTAERIFYFDLASPLAYLAAERVQQVLGGHDSASIEWQPVLARELPGASSSGSQSSAGVFANAKTSPRTAAELRAAVELRAVRQGALPLRWPPDFPFDSEQAMLVATYAKSIGRATAFAQAAFRQAFAGGRSLALSDNLVIAAAACEMHPTAVLRGAGLESVRQQLHDATARAADAGVGYVPAVQVGSTVFVGDEAPEQAAAG